MNAGFELKNLTDMGSKLSQLYKHRLEPGDQVYLKTLNSVYVIKVVKADEYFVSGGWFDRQNLSPCKINIRGCTWGGTAIKTDIIAAPGLCIEFGNNLITSTINKVFYFSYKSNN
ncbi:MAG TPA: hypothetical protein VKD08_11825 [Ignavibacteriaceae bacterium]|jgi:hypothetical protein|nr:hypothetical protein [Ignavibacteriaceae bacterium]